MPKKSKVKKDGTVQKIIKHHSQAPETAEIAVEGAEDLYREIRIENELRGEDGEKVKLKKGAHVDVIVEADKSDTVPKED